MCIGAQWWCTKYEWWGTLMVWEELQVWSVRERAVSKMQQKQWEWLYNKAQKWLGWCWWWFFFFFQFLFSVWVAILEESCLKLCHHWPSKLLHKFNQSFQSVTLASHWQQYSEQVTAGRGLHATWLLGKKMQRWLLKRKCWWGGKYQAVLRLDLI